MARRAPTLTGSPAVPFREVLRRLLPAGTPRQDAEPLREAARRFPVRWTEAYLDLVDPADPDDPIRRIAFPDPREIAPDPGDRVDPVGERDRSPAPYVVRKHRDRAILLVTSTCHVYCRFCFRRSFPDGAHRTPDGATLDAAIDWLAAQPDLREVILSGGDPLTLPDDGIRRIVERLSRSPHLRSLRVHTRAPVHDPARIGPALVEALTSGRPLWMVTHFDHPREVTAEAAGAVRLLQEGGIPVLNQSVLLGRVNDDPAILEDLCRALGRIGVRPYYLHHLDPVPGAASFRVSPSRGLAIHADLRRRLGDGALVPDYVVDLPDGSGKIPVERAVAEGRIEEGPTAGDTV